MPRVIKNRNNQVRLLEYTDQLVEKLRAMVPKAVKDGDETAIHQARVSTRRLKAAVDVFKPVTSKPHRKELTRILAKLRRNLGPARDLDVMLGHLKQMQSRQQQPGVQWLVEQLTKKQSESKRLATEEIDVTKVMSRMGAWWGVRREWFEAGEKLNELIGVSVNLQLDEFIKHADAIAGRQGGEETATVAQTHARMLNPHELRIAGKALRYTLEMAIGGGHRLPAGVSRSFKKMQDALGVWHDQVVLTECTLKLSLKSHTSFHDPVVQLSVLDVAKSSTAKSQRELSKFAKLWNARGEMLAATIRNAFPRVTQVAIISEKISELTADPDPSGSAPLVEHPPQAHSANEPSAA